MEFPHRCIRPFTEPDLTACWAGASTLTVSASSLRCGSARHTFDEFMPQHKAIEITRHAATFPTKSVRLCFAR